MKMTLSEIDSFYFKFKNLLVAEKDATLTLKSESGRTQVTLSVDLDHLLSPEQHGVHHHARNGLSRQRRRERRAEARRIKAAEDNNTIDDANATEEIAVKASEKVCNNESVDNVGEEPNASNNVNHEFCSNNIYAEKAVDDATLVGEILIKPDPENDLKDADVQNLIEYNLKVIGISPVQIEVKRSHLDVISCTVKINPIPRKIIEGRTFPFKNWTWKEAVQNG